MRAFILAAMLVASFSIASVGAQTTAAHYSTAETDIGTLLDDPAARIAQPVAISDTFPGMTPSEDVRVARRHSIGHALRGRGKKNRGEDDAVRVALWGSAAAIALNADSCWSLRSATDCASFDTTRLRSGSSCSSGVGERSSDVARAMRKLHKPRRHMLHCPPRVIQLEIIPRYY